MSKWPLVCVLACACANNVPQDRSTGPDGKIKGALPLVLADGEGKAKGVVTYPGGDRVDLPEGKKGRLDLTMTYTTPRPGLRVAFDVFDQWNIPVINAAKMKGRIRNASIDRAKGKYYVRIYAPRRGDAGSYKLTAEFHPEIEIAGLNPLALNIPDPPKLPDVPPPPSTCEVFDPNDRACNDKCPPGAPQNWKGCPGGATATPPPPPPPVEKPVIEPPKKPVLARVLKIDVAGDGLDVTLSAGSESGVGGKEWKVQVLRGDTQNLLPGAGSATIIRLNKTTTVIHIKLTSDVMSANPNVKLSPQ